MRDPRVWRSAAVVLVMLVGMVALVGVTLTEQPLLVRNGTWIGLVRDPQNLMVGEQLFNPLTASWVNITSLQVLQSKFKVYDLRATAPNDFVANGLLADSKTK